MLLIEISTISLPLIEHYFDRGWIRKEAATLDMGSYFLKVVFFFLIKDDSSVYGKLDKYLFACLHYDTLGEFFFFLQVSGMQYYNSIYTTK